jgi:hypothetical protein
MNAHRIVILSEAKNPATSRAENIYKLRAPEAFRSRLEFHDQEVAGCFASLNMTVLSMR